MMSPSSGGVTLARGLRVSGLAAVCWLAARTAEAKYLHQTPADIVAIRGMPAALAVCGVGLILLRRTIAPDSPRNRPQPVPAAGSPRVWWSLAGALVLMIYATVPIGYQIAARIVATIGHNGFQNALNAIGAGIGAVFVWHVLRDSGRRRWPVLAALAMMSWTYAYFFAVLEVPVKRVHFMEYSLLSALVYQALRSRDVLQIYWWCALAAMLAGTGDEAISLALPRRFGAVSDVIFDTAAGVLGALVVKYVLQAEADRRTTLSVGDERQRQMPAHT
jgi:hypothetical protein